MTRTTKHGNKRVRQRVGLNKKSADKKAEKALKEGITHGETTGNLHKYLTKVITNSHLADTLRVLDGHLYLFKGSVLITTWAIPSNLMKSVNKLKEKQWNM